MADPSPDADADLMLCVKRGGPEASEAFAQLVSRWKQPVMAFVFRTLPDPDEAEDLAQGVFVQLWRTAGRYQPTAKFSTFLFTIARNLCLNEVRRRKRHPADSLDEASPDDESHPARQAADRSVTGADMAMENSELHDKVSEALADLPEKQRTALMLCREGELSYEEIAAILETSVPATKSLIHRAREVLKSRLKPYLRTGEWSNS
ncbi:MAG: sigma-70 family RNA polymerase sigma factor [Verrucomicrobiota bacterium]